MDKSQTPQFIKKMVEKGKILRQKNTDSRYLEMNNLIFLKSSIALWKSAIYEQTNKWRDKMGEGKGGGFRWKGRLKGIGKGRRIYF